MEERQNQRRWLERELRLAIGTDQIALHYQPLFDLATNAVTSFEALARWHHPERGMISPGEFIPVAEATGLIDALGAYVLQKACADAMGWPGKQRVAVNISPIQFREGNLDRFVEEVLRTTRLPSQRLELEITESVILSQDQASFDMLTRLRRLGVRFSMDDFGTGYSSLSSLNTFRFDKIKLDQSFVRNLLEKDEAAAIVHVVAELGRSLKITTTAEGVETPEQLARLRASGFSEVQGYLLSRPIPAADVPDFINTQNALNAAA
jgi:EAL domain-containing protein (putative c-di-GMP-specific phosphodiesterase class I)